MVETACIACDVFRLELEWLERELGALPPIRYLERGLHNHPEQLRARLQEAIDQVERDLAPERILLAYGLCGRGLTGVSAARAVLVVPNVHDCIPLLLGIDQQGAVEYSRGGTTFWLSSGLVQDEPMQFAAGHSDRYAEYVARFGKKRADKLMAMELDWFKMYTNVCLIRWAALDNEADAREARRLAAAFSLPYTERTGSAAYLRALLAGGRDETLFLHLRPGETLDLNAEGRLAPCPVGAV